MIGQAEILYECALVVEQVVPSAVDRKRDVCELIEIRIVDHDNEALEMAIGNAIPMIDNQILIRKASVTVRMIERKRKEIRGAQ